MMRFIEVGLEGAWLIEPEPHHDSRGHFARTFCAREYAARGLETCFVQHSTSHTVLRGTLRGMHFQREPHAEVKLVACTQGAIYDVIVDLRRGSSTFGQWRAFELSAENQRRLYIPKDFAHGFQTLTDDVRVAYAISSFYEPSAAGGVRHNDLAFNIAWPIAVAAISDRDACWPDYQP